MLIRMNRHLFWYIPEMEKENISLEALVETILNYGDLEAVRQLFNTVGIKTVADIFFRQTNRPRVNYFPQVVHFFTLYFNRHVHGSSD
ncbi:MAG: hypothetical protein K0B08_05905 [Bacteroidales bacterium]|nr:hypothetical protein [Bacteroidales bacterium]